MARRVITIDEKIEKAQADVAAAKAKYDALLDELEKLVTKRKQMGEKSCLKPIMQATRQLKKSSNLFAPLSQKWIEG